MPRPAAGVSGKGMPGRRHRTADRQPGAGNSHIGLYVRRDAEASQVTVPAPLLRQGFLREGSGTPGTNAGKRAPRRLQPKHFAPCGVAKGRADGFHSQWRPSFFIGMQPRGTKDDRGITQALRGASALAGAQEESIQPGHRAGTGRKGTIRPAGETLRPIRQICARKGEKQPEGRRMRFSLYRFVL